MAVKNKITCLVLVLISVTLQLSAIKFRWAVEKGVTYKIISYVDEEIYKNSVFLKRVEIRHKALLKATRAVSNASFFEGEFYYYERPKYKAHIPYGLKQRYPTAFWRDALGRYKIDKKYYMPVVRGVPTFPKHDIKPGAMWRAFGSEVHDLKHYGIKHAYKIPIDARYIYIGNEMVNGVKAAKFSISYVFTHASKYKLTLFKQQANRFLRRFRNNRALYFKYRNLLQSRLNRMLMAPKRISASCVLLYYWDIKKKLPLMVTEDFHFVFHLYNNEVHEYKGHAKSTFEKVVPIKKKKVDKLVQKLRDKKIDGVTIKKDKRGVVLHFKDILFDYKSSLLKSGARKNLQEVAKVLRRYKRFDIRVEGHTDSKGDQLYNLRLSRKRARNVSLFLSKLLGINPKKMSWIGYGKRKPIASNSTAEGRAKNRRVEIIILTNE